MKPTIKRISIAFGLAALLLFPEVGRCFYDPSTGKWLNRDPIHEVAGNNLFAFVQNNPATKIDLLGLTGVNTGVSICDGYIKGDPIWGWKSSHTFISAGSVGFGYYAKKHLAGGGAGCGPCGAVCDLYNSLDDQGVVVATDLVVYPTLSNPRNGQAYSKCRPVVLDDNCYDIDKFKRCVESESKKTGDFLRYHLRSFNCSDYADLTVSFCRVKAMKGL